MKVIQFTIPVSKENFVTVQEDQLPYFYNHLHRHHEIQITLILKGKGTLIAGNYMQPFKPGDIYILGSNQPHILKSDPQYFRKKSALTVHALTLFADPNGQLKHFLVLPEAKSVKKFMGETASGLKVPPEHTAAIREQMMQIKDARQGFRVAAFIALLQTMAGIRHWKKLSSITGEQPYSESDGLRMNDVYQYMLHHYSENIKLKTIADIACMTPQAFCRYFKKHTRKTFVNFLNEIRINEACKIIASGNFNSFLSVAYETGFSSAVSFNRVFRRVVAQSPREYLREYSSKID